MLDEERAEKESRNNVSWSRFRHVFRLCYNLESFAAFCVYRFVKIRAVGFEHSVNSEMVEVPTQTLHFRNLWSQ